MRPSQIVPLNAEILVITVDRDRVRRVGLQLNSVGSSFVRRLYDPDGFVEVLIVIGGHVRNDVSGVSGTDSCPSIVIISLSLLRLGLIPTA